MASDTKNPESSPQYGLVNPADDDHLGPCLQLKEAARSDDLAQVQHLLEREWPPDSEMTKFIKSFGIARIMDEALESSSSSVATYLISNHNIRADVVTIHKAIEKSLLSVL
jgi:hypothetical protein